MSDYLSKDEVLKNIKQAMSGAKAPLTQEMKQDAFSRLMSLSNVQVKTRPSGAQQG